MRPAPSRRPINKGRHTMRKKFAAAICAAVVAGLGAGGALAGEVQGPPGSPTNPGPNPTGAPEHSNSVCSSTGLIDFTQAQKIDRTQHPANRGVPGKPVAVAAA